MNIFYLDNNPIKAAQYLADRHICKMQTEMAQMLSNVSLKLGGQSPPKVNGEPYKLAQPNHPCALWVAKSIDNWNWGYKHAIAICEEYTRRYHKTHGTEKALRWLYEHGKKPIEKGLSKPTLAMPIEYQTEDPVLAYRLYYICEKTWATWKSPAKIPEWFSNTDLLSHV